MATKTLTDSSLARQRARARTSALPAQLAVSPPRIQTFPECSQPSVSATRFLGDVSQSFGSLALHAKVKSP